MRPLNYQVREIGKTLTRTYIGALDSEFIKINVTRINCKAGVLPHRKSL